MDKCPNCNRPNEWRWVVDCTTYYETLVCRECTGKENEEEWRSTRWMVLVFILIIPITILIRKIIGL